MHPANRGKLCTMSHLRAFVRSTPWLVVIVRVVHNALGGNHRRIRGQNNTIESRGVLARATRISITGNNNVVIFGPGSRLRDVEVTMHGNGHVLLVGSHARANRTEFAFEDEDCRITVGTGTTIDGAHIAAAEPGRAVTI
eukprot:gene5726-6833_t